MLGEYSLVDLIRPLFALSPLVPREQQKFEQLLEEFFDSRTILKTLDYSECKELIYEGEPGNIYHIFAVSYAENGYVFIVTDNETRQFQPVFKDLMKFHKSFLEESEFRGLGEWSKTWNEYTRSIREVLLNSKRATRQLSDEVHQLLSEDFVFPSDQILSDFYNCGRKIQFQSREEAEANGSPEKDIYECAVCSNYHLGFKPTGQSIPEEVMQGRYRTAWRRYHD